MQAATLLCRREGGSGSGGRFAHMLEFIRAYDIWQQPRFWEALLWEDLATAFAGGADGFDPAPFCLQQAYAMVFHWHIAAAIVRPLFQQCAARLQLPQAEERLLKPVDGYLEAAPATAGAGAADKLKKIQKALAKSRGDAAAAAAATAAASLGTIGTRQDVCGGHEWAPRTLQAVLADCVRCRQPLFPAAVPAVQCLRCGAPAHKSCP
jgi:hypothetical protein